MAKDWDPTTLFDVLGDELVRDILVMASERPVSAETVAEHSEASLPTVYRRLDTLEELDLLDERVRVDGDGTQYREYETTLKRISFEIADGGFDIDMRLRRDVSDRFQAFWEELEGGSGNGAGAPSGVGSEPGGDANRG
ncbi:MAG: ArsR family transcriptional regulator [Halobacteriales archaeon]